VGYEKQFLRLISWFHSFLSTGQKRIWPTGQKLKPLGPLDHFVSSKKSLIIQILYFDSMLETGDTANFLNAEVLTTGTNSGDDQRAPSWRIFAEKSLTIFFSFVYGQDTQEVRFLGLTVHQKSLAAGSLRTN